MEVVGSRGAFCGICPPAYDKLKQALLCWRNGVWAYTLSCLKCPGSALITEVRITGQSQFLVPSILEA